MSPKNASTNGRSLLAIGSAAVLAVYAAGYIRTRPAAAAFANEATAPRPAHLSPTYETKSPGEVTDSIAVAAITVAVNSPRRVAAPTKRSPRPRPAARQVATTTTAKRRKATTVVAAAPAPVRSAPTQAPAVPEPVAVAPAPAAPPAPPRGQYRDGTYRGYGTSRHGDIEAEVQISGGRIASARITQCLTRYSCSRISNLLDEVVARQSANVDYVSGATQSSDAFMGAVADALTKAR